MKFKTIGNKTFNVQDGNERQIRYSAKRQHPGHQAPGHQHSGLILALGLSLGLSSGLALAAVPNAGNVMQEPHAAPAQPAAEPVIPHVAEPAPGMFAAGWRVTVKGLHITGETVFTEDQLLALVQDGIGKEMSLIEINQLASRITLYYRKHGYLVARAYIPVQEIQKGRIEIAVVEGDLGKVDLNNTAGLKASALAPVSILDSGKPLRKDQLEQSLLMLSDLPGVEVKSTLKPGEAVGTSDLLLDVAPGRKVEGSVDADSYGNRYTGTDRLGATLYYNNPLKRGDQASVRLQTSGGGLAYGRVGYQLPFGTHGTRVGTAWSEMHYKLGQDFSSLNATGNATVGSLYLRYPVVRSRVFNLFAQAQYDSKHLTDNMGSTADDKKFGNWTAGISGSSQDGLGLGENKGGSNNFSLTYTLGKLGLDATSKIIDAVTAKTEGGFGKANLSLQRLQRVTGEMSLDVSYEQQLASKNLDSAEKFSLGGVYGVRAYPQGEASADDAQLLKLELRQRIGTDWQVLGFYDAGWAKTNHNPWIAGSNTQHLAGVGMGASFTMNKIRASLSVAWRAGTAQPVSDTAHSPRLWFQAVRYF